MAKKSSYQVKQEQLKARFLRAFPYLAGVHFVVFPRSAWKGELHFKSRSCAARFVKVATEGGHEAFGHREIKKSGIDWVRTKTFKTVTATINPEKRTPPKPTPSFSPETVKVRSKPGRMTKEGVLRDFERFPVGKKVVGFLNGEVVEDAGCSGKMEMLEVTQAGVSLKVRFARVSMEWFGSARDGSWHLTYYSNNGGASENVKETNLALWKLLCTAWNVGGPWGDLLGRCKSQSN